MGNRQHKSAVEWALPIFIALSVTLAFALVHEKRAPKRVNVTIEACIEAFMQQGAQQNGN